MVNFVGEPIAAVAADDEATADEAIALIKVEYEDIPSVVNPLAAMVDGAASVHPDLESYEGYGFTMGHNVSTLLDADRGDVEQAFRDADVIVEDVYRSQGINQGFLEPMACVADVEPGGGWSFTHPRKGRTPSAPPWPPCWKCRYRASAWCRWNWAAGSAQSCGWPLRHSRPCWPCGRAGRSNWSTPAKKFSR